MNVIPTRVFAGVVALAVALLASPVFAQGERKMQDYEKKELQSVVALLDHAIASQLPDGVTTFDVDPSKKEKGFVRGTDAPAFQFHFDAIRANDGKSYMPFMFLLDPAKMPGTNVALGLRVVPKGTSAPVKASKDQPAYPWEEESFSEVRPGPLPKMAHVARVFQVAAGEYDVYFVLRPHSLQKTKEAPFSAVVLKQTVAAPDFGSAVGLTTSTVMVLSKMEQVTVQMTPDMQKERPYIMGSLELVPSIDRAYKKADNFGVFFQVYNATLEGTKPDITVEYAFHRKDGEAEKYFNKTQPQSLNGQTLPPTWDGTMGSVLTTGQEIPLASFPEGEYRLEIKVTDNKASKGITRDVKFTVAP
jgi:hypothetical protein